MMNKKILALAIAGVIAAPVAAQADVKVYGKASVETGSIDNGTDTQTVQGDPAEGSGPRSRIGFLATEDLGGGLTGIAKAEFQYDPSDNARFNAVTGLVIDADGNVTGTKATGSPFTGRDSFVALKGGFGLIGFGQFNGVYKTHGGVKYDPWVTTSMQARGNGGMASGILGNNGFIPDLVVYQTPMMGPAQITAAYLVDETDMIGGASIDGSYQLGAKLNFGKNVEAIASYGHLEIDSAVTDLTDNWKVGGKFAAGPATVTVEYEDVEQGGFDGTGTFLYASAKLDFGKVSIIPALGQFSGDADNSDADYVAVGAMYNFSKMTKGWVGYRDTNADKDEKDETATTVGLRMDF